MSFPLVMENILDRNYTVAAPSQVWVSGIADTQTNEEFLHLTTVIDWYDRKIVGWSLIHGIITEETSLAV